MIRARNLVLVLLPLLFGAASLRDGESLYGEGKFAEAKPIFQTLAKEQATNDRAWFYLAAIEAKDRNWKDAEFCQRKALGLRPKDPDYLFNMASIRYQLGAPAEAEKLYLEAIGQRSDFPEAHLRLSKILLEEKRLSETLDQLHRVLVLRPKHPDREKIESLIAKMNAAGVYTTESNRVLAQVSNAKALAASNEAVVRASNAAVLFAASNEAITRASNAAIALAASNAATALAASNAARAAVASNEALAQASNAAVQAAQAASTNASAPGSTNATAVASGDAGPASTNRSPDGGPGQPGANGPGSPGEGPPRTIRYSTDVRSNSAPREIRTRPEGSVGTKPTDPDIVE